jgi:2-(1,2-epoxy-1,2-dihydrophenyl)acetyl-CoA isomerase
MPTYQTIHYSVDQAVATILLNRPERRNAVTAEMLAELAAALDRAAADPAVRAIVLGGAGKGFCAGQDLSAFGSTPDPAAVRTAVLEGYKPVILRLCGVEKPVIGAINGAAAGAGASLALACDLRIMAEDAYLLHAFSNIGLLPDAGSCWFLVRQVGYSRAFALAAEAERLSAQRCLALGLANRLAPAAELMDQALAWAEQLAARPTLALGLTKRAMLAATERSLAEIIELEADLQTLAVQSADHREGVVAFLEKRPPVFQGR